MGKSKRSRMGRPGPAPTNQGQAGFNNWNMDSGRFWPHHPQNNGYNMNNMNYRPQNQYGFNSQMPYGQMGNESWNGRPQVPYWMDDVGSNFQHVASNLNQQRYHPYSVRHQNHSQPQQDTWLSAQELFRNNFSNQGPNSNYDFGNRSSNFSGSGYWNRRGIPAENLNGMNVLHQVMTDAINSMYKTISDNSTRIMTLNGPRLVDKDTAKALVPKFSEVAYSQDELKQLYSKAEEYIKACKGNMIESVCFYRDKSEAYFVDIFRQQQGIMEVYTKDNHGDPNSPINGVVDGLFFNVNMTPSTGLPPTQSNFGDQRLSITPRRVFDICPNVYFTDFYCVKYNVHYITLVMAKEGSRADTFGKTSLIPFDMSNNPFIRWADNKFYTTTGLWIEILVTENLDLIHEMKLGAMLTRVEMKGVRSGGRKGIPKNRSCEICNLKVHLVVNKQKRKSSEGSRKSDTSKKRKYDDPSISQAEVNIFEAGPSPKSSATDGCNSISGWTGKAEDTSGHNLPVIDPTAHKSTLDSKETQKVEIVTHTGSCDGTPSKRLDSFNTQVSEQITKNPMQPQKVVSKNKTPNKGSSATAKTGSATTKGMPEHSPAIKIPPKTVFVAKKPLSFQPQSVLETIPLPQVAHETATTMKTQPSTSARPYVQTPKATQNNQPPTKMPLGNVDQNGSTCTKVSQELCQTLSPGADTLENCVYDEKYAEAKAVFCLPSKETHLDRNHTTQAPKFPSCTVTSNKSYFQSPVIGSETLKDSKDVQAPNMPSGNVQQTTVPKVKNSAPPRPRTEICQPRISTTYLKYMFFEPEYQHSSNVTPPNAHAGSVNVSANSMASQQILPTNIDLQRDETSKAEEIVALKCEAPSRRITDHKYFNPESVSSFKSGLSSQTKPLKLKVDLMVSPKKHLQTLFHETRPPVSADSAELQNHNRPAA